jgi:hypothetical protein
VVKTALDIIYVQYPQAKQADSNLIIDPSLSESTRADSSERFTRDKYSMDSSEAQNYRGGKTLC